MDAQKKAYIDQLMPHIEAISQMDAEALSIGKDLGAINFQSGLSMFKQAINLIRELKQLQLDTIPTSNLTALRDPLKNLAEELKNISEFTLVRQPDPENRRNTLLRQTSEFYDKVVNCIMPFIAYLRSNTVSVQDTINQSRELLDETRKRIATDIVSIESMKSEVDGLLQATKNAAATIGVAQFATVFSSIAVEYAESAKKWLSATVWLGTATAFVAALFLFFGMPSSAESNPIIAQYLITKLVIISILYYAVVWSAKNYRTYRHLVVLNQHRQNALTTFETFVKASNDGQTKNAVLLEATRCIFTNISSGYLGNEEEPPNNRIIEILKTVSGGKSDA